MVPGGLLERALSSTFAVGRLADREFLNDPAALLVDPLAKIAIGNISNDSAPDSTPP
jgi:hypothetical protein